MNMALLKAVAAVTVALGSAAASSYGAPTVTVQNGTYQGIHNSKTTRTSFLECHLLNLQQESFDCLCRSH